MKFEVLLTHDAQRDLLDIHAWIEESDGPAKAGHVSGRLERAIESLGDTPDRGAWPGELEALGIREYRQVHFKPYRMICRVVGKRVFVVLVADGRRDMQTLLSRRLLGA